MPSTLPCLGTSPKKALFSVLQYRIVVYFHHLSGGAACNRKLVEILFSTFSEAFSLPFASYFFCSNTKEDNTFKKCAFRDSLKLVNIQALVYSLRATQFCLIWLIFVITRFILHHLSKKKCSTRKLVKIHNTL